MNTRINSSRKYWIMWGVLTVCLSGFLLYGLSFANLSEAPLRAQVRAMLLPGKTTSGHYQIELACNACHSEVMAGAELLQNACESCHAAELKAARDSHPKSKFTDPRNADRAARLNAAYCVTCHVEHKPHLTQNMGVTLPNDFCHTCHDDIAKDRPSHKDLPFNSCASAGCHNFHDNQALYEDFLLKHAHDPKTSNSPLLPERDFVTVIEELSDYPLEKYPLTALERQNADWTLASNNPDITQDWLETSHAKSGVNCSACHQQQNADNSQTWIERPSPQICSTCHAAEVKTFTSGKHGMRLTQNLPELKVADARIAMRKDAHFKSLNCTSCHSAHRFNTQTASVDACLGCHNDQHSLAYKQSQHFTLWQKEISGNAPAGSGVSCASCHLPRVEFRTPDDIKRVLVQHNQNDDLRPNEKMIRPVCMSCHSLQDSINALADSNLIRLNFSRSAEAQIKSINMALLREAESKKSRAAASGATEQ